MAFKAVGKFLNDTLLQIAGEKYRDFTRCSVYWRNIVGNSTAENALPYKLENGILKVGVKNSIWLQELILYKFKIINAYRKRGIQIKDIIFFINSDNQSRGWKR